MGQKCRRQGREAEGMAAVGTAPVVSAREEELGRHSQRNDHDRNKNAIHGSLHSFAVTSSRSFPVGRCRGEALPLQPGDFRPGSATKRARAMDGGLAEGTLRADRWRIRSPTISEEKIRQQAGSGVRIASQQASVLRLFGWSPRGPEPLTFGSKDIALTPEPGGCRRHQTAADREVEGSVQTRGEGG